MKKLAFIAAAIVVAGCATKTRDVELDGMYVSEAGTLAIGSVDIQAAPVGEETVTIKYDEDTAWLSPSTKTHSIKIMLTGTNSVESATSIVAHICEAFILTGADTNAISQAYAETDAQVLNAATNAASIVESATSK